MFEVAQYAPLLHTRQAEIRGLRELPEGTKDLLFPLFALRPWPRAKSINSAIDHVISAMGGRLFGLDFERDFPPADPENPAQVEFDALRSPVANFSNYFERIEEIDGAVPVLQLTGDLDQLPHQIERVAEIGRGGFCRITADDAHKVTQVRAAIANMPADEFSVFIDAGWRTDILSQSAWALGIAQKFFEQTPERAIVICGSSFPMDFSKVGASSSFDINERGLFQHVRSNLNANLIYGDWASTRPPSYDQGVKRTVSRLDVPLPATWNIFRAQKYEDPTDEDQWLRETYQELADRVVEDDCWGDIPTVWGRYAVECTAAELPNSIKSPIIAAAARVNLHLHIQAHYNTPELIGNTDDPYTD